MLRPASLGFAAASPDHSIPGITALRRVSAATRSRTKSSGASRQCDFQIHHSRIVRGPPQSLIYTNPPSKGPPEFSVVYRVQTADNVGVLVAVDGRLLLKIESKAASAATGT